MERTVLELEVGENGEVAEYKFTIVETTVIHRIKRDVLQGIGETYFNMRVEAAEQKGIHLSLSDLSALRVATTMLYPSTVAATEEAEGVELDMTAAQFCELSDKITGPWSDAVYDLNPHWLPGFALGGPEGEEEKSDGK